MSFGMLVSAWLVVGPLAGGLGDLFDHQEKDFGNVPHGSVSVHHFVLKNTTSQDIRIASMRSTCRCASPSAPRALAKPGEELTVDVKYDATTFVGPRSMTIYVTFDLPAPEVVALRVSGYSRQDVVFNPGQIDFGVISRGAGGTQTAALEYAGALDWKVTDVRPGQWFDAKIDPMYREPGRVGYQVTVALKKDAPPGALAESITFQTNDPTSPAVQLQAAATIQAPLTASPSLLELGAVHLGEKISKKVLLRSDHPFAIQSVSGAVEGVNVQATQGERTVHVVNVDFVAQAAGKFEQTILVRTNLASESPVPIRILGNAAP